MKNEKQKYTPAQGAWSVVDQALNAAFAKGVFDRQDSKVINAAMDVLAEAIAPAPAPVMKAEAPAGKEVKLETKTEPKNAE